MSDKGLARAKKRIEEQRAELEGKTKTDANVDDDKTAADQASKEAAEKEAADQATKDAEEQAAVDQAAKDAADQADKDSQEKAQSDQATKDAEEQAAKDAAAQESANQADKDVSEWTPEEIAQFRADAAKHTAEVARLKAVTDEQRKKINDEDGARGAAIQSLRHENALMFEQLQQARTEREAAAAEPADYDDPISKEKLDAWIARVPKRLRDKYEDEYWQDAARVSIIADQVRVSETSNTDPRVDAHEKSIQDMASDRWLTDADRLATEAGAEGFIAANQSDEGWAQRLQQPVFPGSAMTTKEFLELPGTQPRAAADMYVQYKGVTVDPAAPPAKPPQPGPTRPTLREQVTNRPSATPGRKDTPKTMTQVEYERRRHDRAYANGDPAKEAEWNEARRFKAEGRVSG